jgi:hypothetical protein
MHVVFNVKAMRGKLGELECQAEIAPRKHIGHVGTQRRKQLGTDRTRDRFRPAGLDAKRNVDKGAVFSAVRHTISIEPYGASADAAGREYIGMTNQHTAEDPHELGNPCVDLDVRGVFDDNVRHR